MTAALLVAVALSSLPLQAGAQVRSFQAQPLQRATFAACAVPQAGTTDTVSIAGPTSSEIAGSPSAR
ncbi:hypothetical protein [Bradyrhizobium sp. LMTR 3]|uniref:hypothetical protein n=1 Tax=Bradyrhizobium sp. LMTR 3 TaxID=189873 RepID=UPI0011479053|nr:hypothetical protein [Bradyrhizobium sp. LMTR 3]